MSFRIQCTMYRIHCVRFSGRINSPRFSRRPYWSDATKTNLMRFKLSQCNARTSIRTSYNVLCTRTSDARFLKVIKWIAAVYLCVFRQWDGFLICLKWSSNVFYHCLIYQHQFSMLCSKNIKYFFLVRSHVKRRHCLYL